LLALHGLDKLLARIGLAKKSGTVNKQGGHTGSQRTAGRVDDAQVRAKLDGTPRQFKSIEATGPSGMLMSVNSRTMGAPSSNRAIASLAFVAERVV